MWQCFIVTSPTGAAAQYCDEYVCLSVCSREYLQNHTCDFYQIFLACCHWLWLGPTLEGWWHSKGKGQFWGFSHWQCIVQNSIWDPYKNGWTNQDIVLDDELAWPEEHCVTWGWRSPKGKLQLWGKTCLTSLTPARIANWTGPWSSMHTIGTDAWLQVLDESIIGCKGGGVAHWAKSDIYECHVYYFVLLLYCAADCKIVMVSNNTCAVCQFHCAALSLTLRRPVVLLVNWQCAQSVLLHWVVCYSVLTKLTHRSVIGRHVTRQ